MGQKPSWDGSSFVSRDSCYNEIKKAGEAMKWQMPIGVDNFFDIRSKHYYFVDKTDFIRQLIDGHSAVTLITRPRRFGKTLTLSMLEYFFSIEKKHRAATSSTAWLSTWPGLDYMAQRGQYPVLFLSLKDLKDLTWPQMLQSLSSWISYWFIDHDYLADSPSVNPDLRRRFLALKQQASGQNEMQLGPGTVGQDDASAFWQASHFID